MQVATFPDVEDLIRVYLGEHLPEPVSLARPGQPAAGHVLVWRAGGTRDRLIDRPMVNIEAWHARGGRALAMVSDATDYLIALGGNSLDGWQITGAHGIGGVASLPDPRWPGVARYTSMVELRVRGVRR